MSWLCVRLAYSGVGQHALDGSCVGLINVAGLPVATGQLGGLLGQDVAAECVAALDLAVLGQLKALLSAGVRLQFHLSHFSFLLKF